MAMDKKDKKDRKDRKMRETQQRHNDVLAASKPLMPAEEGAAAAQDYLEEHDDGQRDRQVHGDSREPGEKAALNADPNTAGSDPPMPDEPRFPRPGSLAIDSDGLAASPAEMVSTGRPSTAVVDTEGAPLSPPASAPAAAGWASEMAAARAGADDMMMKLTPAGIVDPFAGFRESKAHRQGDTGQYAPIPGGAEVAQGHEVATFDEMSRPGSAAALLGKPGASQPNGQPARPGEHSVVGPSIRAVSPADITAAGS